MIDDLSIDRLIEIKGVINRNESERVKESYQIAAFIGFQSGAAGDKNFGQYLEDLGLSGDTAVDKPTSKVTKEEALAKAEAIMNSMKQDKGK